MTESTIVPANGINAHRRGHRVTLQWWTQSGPEAQDMEWHEIVLPVEEAESLLLALATSCHVARRTQVDDAIAGDCPTCGNVRLIDVPRPHGRGTEAVRCPDCSPRIEAFRNGTAPLPELIPERYRDLA